MRISDWSSDVCSSDLPHALLRLNHADCGYAAVEPSPSRGGVGWVVVSWGDEHRVQQVAIQPLPSMPLEGGWAKKMEGFTILRDGGFGLEAGDRIGLLGANGAGKSTLVKTLVGELEPLAGERYAHPDLRIGYFAQHTVEALRAGTSPVDHLRELSPDASTQAFRDFLGKWNFPGDRAFESIDGFSGGERARLALALIAWKQPNVLLLDEPTNHLDLDMREALAEALSDFDGAIVLVSHDRHLIGLVSDTFWRVHDGVVEPFDGDLDEYAAWLRSRSGDARGNQSRPAVAQAPAGEDRKSTRLNSSH